MHIYACDFIVSYLSLAFLTMHISSLHMYMHVCVGVCYM